MFLESLRVYREGLRRIWERKREERERDRKASDVFATFFSPRLRSPASWSANFGSATATWKAARVFIRIKITLDRWREPSASQPNRKHPGNFLAVPRRGGASLINRLSPLRDGARRCNLMTPDGAWLISRQTLPSFRHRACNASRDPIPVARFSTFPLTTHHLRPSRRGNRGARISVHAQRRETRR